MAVLYFENVNMTKRLLTAARRWIIKRNTEPARITSLFGSERCLFRGTASRAGLHRACQRFRPVHETEQSRFVSDWSAPKFTMHDRMDLFLRGWNARLSIEFRFVLSTDERFSMTKGFAIPFDRLRNRPISRIQHGTHCPAILRTDQAYLQRSLDLHRLARGTTWQRTYIKSYRSAPVTIGHCSRKLFCPTLRSETLLDRV